MKTNEHEGAMQGNNMEKKGGNESGKTGKKGRRGPFLIAGIVLAVMIAAGLCVGAYFLWDYITYVSTDDAAIDGNHVNLSSKMLGRIQKILVAEGDKVQVGQLLVQLDDADLRAQESQAAASLNYAEKNLAVARINVDKLRGDFQRTKSLYGTGASTKEQYDHAANAMDTADAQVSLTLAQIETSRAQLGVIETQLLNTRIVAPISGTVAKQSLMQGDIAQPGQTILSINDLGSVWITANYEETKIHSIRVGAPVDITVDAHPGRVFKGKVTLISAGIVPPSFQIGEFTKTTQRIPVRIAMDEVPESTLLVPGMSVVVKVKAR